MDFHGRSHLQLQNVEELKFDKNGNAIPQYELKRKM